MGWCDDVKSSNYNKLIKINNNENMKNYSEEIIVMI